MIPVRRWTLLLFLAVSSFALELPPRPTASFVYDGANVLSPQAEQNLNSRLEAFRQATGRTLLAATFPDLQGETPESFGIRLAEAWKPGTETKDDGAIVFIGVGDRRSRIEVGYGLEGELPDAIAGRILTEDMTPHLREGDYDAAFDAGTASIVRTLGGDPGVVAVAPQRRRSKQHLPMWLLVPIIIGVFFLRTRTSSLFIGSRGWSSGGSSFGGLGGGGWSGGSSGGGFGGGGSSGSW